MQRALLLRAKLYDVEVVRSGLFRRRELDCVISFATESQGLQKLAPPLFYSRSGPTDPYSPQKQLSL